MKIFKFCISRVVRYCNTLTTVFITTKENKKQKQTKKYRQQIMSYLLKWTDVIIKIEGWYFVLLLRTILKVRVRARVTTNLSL